MAEIADIPPAFPVPPLPGQGNRQAPHRPRPGKPVDRPPPADGGHDPHEEDEPRPGRHIDERALSELFKEMSNFRRGFRKPAQ